MAVTAGENPFLCLDLTYISGMLQELGFPKDKVFKVRTKLQIKAIYHSFEINCHGVALRLCISMGLHRDGQRENCDCVFSAGEED
jgi:hypothetical protein